ncbi:hypothetical protein LIER_23177 [Lithospermum erythrorhizon]|uniref:Uncharacterized protein n=1 Tax=Lithospermum erythrorhizon TaxID=34254 RepID=A0AAV3QY03_LITER
MALRRNSGALEPPINVEANMLTITLHHDGALLRSPQTKYVSGVVVYFDHIDGKTVSINDLKEFVVNVGLPVIRMEQNLSTISLGLNRIRDVDCLVRIVICWSC